MKTTPGLQYTAAMLARAHSRCPNMNHLWGMRQNEPLFRTSFWATGGRRGLPRVVGLWCLWLFPCRNRSVASLLDILSPDGPLKTQGLDWSYGAFEIKWGSEWRCIYFHPATNSEVIECGVSNPHLRSLAHTAFIFALRESEPDGGAPGFAFLQILCVFKHRLYG